jgi:hypothetical protein
MRRRYLLVSALLLAHPVLLLRGDAPDALPMFIFLAAVIIGLLRGSGWAYGAALALSLGVAVIVVIFNAMMVIGFALDEPWFGPGPWHAVIGPTLARELSVALASGAAFVLLLRDPERAELRGRMLAALGWTFGAEAALMALIAAPGIGSGVRGHSLYQDLLGLSQTPGELVITQVGYCCVAADLARPRLGSVTLEAVPALVAAGTFGLLPITLFVLASRDARRASVRARMAS